MKTKITTRTPQDKEYLKNKTVYALPDNPSNKGFSASQIKAKTADPSLILFDWLQGLAQETSDGFAEFDENLDETIENAVGQILSDELVLNIGSIHNMTLDSFKETYGTSNSLFKVNLMGAPYLFDVISLYPTYTNCSFTSLRGEDTRVFTGTISFDKTIYQLFNQCTVLSDIKFQTISPYYKLSDLANKSKNKPFFFQIDGDSDNNKYVVTYKYDSSSYHMEFEMECLTNSDRYYYSNNGYESDLNSLYLKSDLMTSANKRNYEVVKNKVTTLSSSSTDTEYPSAKCVWDLISTVKRNAYIEVNTDDYPTLDSFLTNYDGEEGYVYLYPIDASDRSKGYKQYIWDEINETNNYLVWIYLGDTQLDLTPYYRRDQDVVPSSNQTNNLGSSQNGFNNGYIQTLYIGENKDWAIWGDSEDFGIGDVITFYQNSAVSFASTVSAIYPEQNNYTNLGSPSNKLKDGYFAGTLYGNVYDFTIDSVYKIVYSRKRNDDTLTQLSYEFLNICSKTADTTFTFQTPRTDCMAEYKAIITNSGASAITLTFTGVTNILCNDDNIVVTNATNSTLVLPAGASIEVSIQSGKMVAIKW